MTPLSARTPPSITARRQGNADLRPPLLDSAAKGKNPAFPHGAPLRAVPTTEARPAGKGTPTSGRHCCAKRSEGKTPELPHGAPLSAVPTNRHGPQARERRPPVGTAARSAAKGRLPNSRMAPLSAQSPPAEMAPPGWERRPPVGTAARSAAKAAYSPTLPVMTHATMERTVSHRASQRDSAAQGKNPELPHGAPLGAVPTRRDGTARLGPPVFRPAPLPRGERTAQSPLPVTPRTPRRHNPHPRRTPCKAPSPPSSCSRAKPKKP